MSSSRGRLFIVSAPSGTGKTTLVERLIQITPNLRMSRSYTSRAPRAGERHGVDYNFVSRERFEAMVQADAFLEWATVFGNHYGTGAEETESALAGGEDLALVIDVQGARQLRARDVAQVAIFVLPPSATVLEHRLRGRSQDSEEQIRCRLEVAREEVTDVAAYDYVVINDDLEHGVERLHAIVMAERSRATAMHESAVRIIRTFGKEETSGKTAKGKSL